MGVSEGEEGGCHLKVSFLLPQTLLSDAEWRRKHQEEVGTYPPSYHQSIDSRPLKYLAHLLATSSPACP